MRGNPRQIQTDAQICHTERSEVSINLKCDFSALRRVLNSVNFSLTLKMTKCAFFVSGFFVVAVPCKLVKMCEGFAFFADALRLKQQKQISLRLHLIEPFVSKAGGRVVFIAGFAVVASCQSLVPAFVVFAKCEASLA